MEMDCVVNLKIPIENAGIIFRMPQATEYALSRS